MTHENQWDWWLAAIDGERRETEKGNPYSGFYRYQDKACAIWRDEDGTLCAEVSSGFCPRQPDEIDEAFGFWSVRPIAHEVYVAFAETGKWPDSIEVPEVAHAQDTPEHERLKAEVQAAMKAAADWYNALPAGISTDDEDAKAANFAKHIAALGKKAEERRVELKKPVLDLQRKIDGDWKPVVDAADVARSRILAPTLDYRKKRAAEEEEKRQREIRRQMEEQRAREAEHARQVEAARQQAPVTGDVPQPVAPPPPPPPAVPVSLPPARATGLRKVKVVEFTSIQETAAYFAKMNEVPVDLVEVLKKLSRRVMEAGVSVPGARLVDDVKAR